MIDNFFVDLQLFNKYSVESINFASELWQIKINHKSKIGNHKFLLSSTFCINFFNPNIMSFSIF